MPRVRYSSPTGRRPHPGYCLAATDILMTSTVMRDRPWRKGDRLFSAGPVQMARSAIVMDFLKTDCDYLLMHDDDLEVSPFGPHGNPIDGMVAFMDAHPDVGVIGSVYLREGPIIPLVNMWHPAWPPTETDPGEMVNAVCNMPDEPFECAAIGTGFFMVRRAAAKAMCDRDGGNAGPPFSFAVVKNRWGERVELGEDFGFCLALQRLGWKVMADPRFPTIHFKESGHLPYDHAKWNAMGTFQIDADKRTRTINVSVPGHETRVTCIDVSEVRRAEAAERGVYAAERAAPWAERVIYQANRG